MNICIISKASPRQLPPVQMVAAVCRQLGHTVTLISQNVGEDGKFLEGRGVEIISMNNSLRGTSPLGKLNHWRKFAKHVRSHTENMDQSTVFWVSGADTLILLKKSFLEKSKVIFQLNELNDDLPLYRALSKQKMQMCHKVVVPEINRSYISQVMYGLPKIPYVLPNKPFEFTEPEQEIPRHIQQYIEEIDRRKNDGKVVLIYQGFISELRDMTQISEFVAKHSEKFSLVLMGEDEGALKKYRSICPDIIHVPFIPAPWHLLVTAHCNVGILVYLPVSLNNIYCAPNKIWEYSKFGLAMVGNDIPGLLFLNDKELGCTVSLDNFVDIEKKLLKIGSRASEYAANSRLFYESLDLCETVRTILAE